MLAVNNNFVQKYANKGLQKLGNFKNSKKWGHLKANDIQATITTAPPTFLNMYICAITTVPPIPQHVPCTMTVPPTFHNTYISTITLLHFQLLFQHHLLHCHHIPTFCFFLSLSCSDAAVSNSFSASFLGLHFCSEFRSEVPSSSCTHTSFFLLNLTSVPVL